jgi:predicted secreted protein
MGPITSIAVFLTIWWTVLFAVLPLGNRTHHEEGIPVPGGGDPGSPVNPNLKRKFITTTWVSAVMFVALMATIHFGLIKLPSMPANY